MNKGLMIRLSAEERALLQKNALAKGLSMNAFIKRLIGTIAIDTETEKITKTTGKELVPQNLEQKTNTPLLDWAANTEVRNGPIKLHCELERMLLKAIAACLPVSVFRERYAMPRNGIPISKLKDMLIRSNPSLYSLTDNELLGYLKERCPSFFETAPSEFYANSFRAIIGEQA